MINKIQMLLPLVAAVALCGCLDYTDKFTINPDGSGVVRAKAWKRDEPEPENWTLEVPHRTAHQTGCPGLFGRLGTTSWQSAQVS